MSDRAFCDVALRMPVRRLFTYRVPEALVPFVEPGVRVHVPLRRDHVVGIVRRTHGRAPDMETRSVIDVIDERPWYGPDLLALGDWLAEYYFCSPGEALFAMLPSGLGAQVDTVYRHSPERVPVADLSPAERRLCRYLAEHPGSSRRELLLAFPQRSTMQRLDKLVSSGTVSGARQVRAHRVASITEAIVEWVGPEPGDRDRSDPFAQHLATAGGPVRLGQLRDVFPDASRRLLRLSRRNLVRTRRVPASYEPAFPPVMPESPIRLTPAQEQAWERIAKTLGAHAAFLLYGVTGSGKTEVYIRAISRVLDTGDAALYLVPEIGLAGHLLARLTPHFRNQVVVLHSGLTARERALAWQAVHRGERKLVVGTRSAVLAPIERLRLVIVDEEQDSSFKQDQPAPRYHARDVAVWRARRSGAVCILGTATPSLESWHNAATGKYVLLELPERIGSRAVPAVQLIDRRKERPQVKGGLITTALVQRLRNVLGEHGQAILFLNRRGFSGAMRCTECGHVSACPDCSVAFTYHRDLRQLRCHFCGHAEPAPSACPQCAGREFAFPRAGTQQVEQELTTLFPDARIGRLDLDVAARRGGAESVLSGFGRHELDILLGTQMVTKGLHFPRVALVGILNTDLSMDLPDFRAAERTAQQILQVAGRAGRGDVPGEVYAQTFAPDQPLFERIVINDYAGFVRHELEARHALGYPPSRHIVAIWALAESDEAAESAIRRLGRSLTSKSTTVFRLLGPAPAPLRRLRRLYRWHLILLTDRVKSTLAHVEHALNDTIANGARFNVDVDPVHLL